MQEEILLPLNFLQIIASKFDNVKRTYQKLFQKFRHFAYLNRLHMLSKQTYQEENQKDV